MALTGVVFQRHQPPAFSDALMNFDRRQSRLGSGE
jgi:hypothetical protein